MRIFVLSAGGCGSSIFARACAHVENYSVGHQSRARCIGSERLNYPDAHIEIDNRLAWFLGGLDKAYGDSAWFVHLTRDPQAAAERYAESLEDPTSILGAFRQGILMDAPYGDLDVCLDAVQVMHANIEHFLKRKSHVLPVAFENLESDFGKFWEWIGATGSREDALAELRKLHHDQVSVKEADSSPYSSTHLSIGSLREHIDRLHGRILSMNDDVSLAKYRRDAAVAERKAFKAYSGQLERQLRRMGQSRTWRLLAPYRAIMGRLRAIARGAASVPAGPLQAPSLATSPDSNSPSPETDAKLLLHGGIGLGSSLVTRLGRKMWSGFSQSALRDLYEIKQDKDRASRERSDAAYVLARWQSVHGETEDALKLVDEMIELYPRSASMRRRALARALLLCRAQRSEDARELIEAYGNELDPAVLLLQANTCNPSISDDSSADSDAMTLSKVNALYDRFGFGALEKRQDDRPLSIDNIRGVPGREFERSDSKVTVIVPAFNAQETIATALAGIAGQTWENLEVLVVDDLSTDETADVVADFCREDSRFRLIRQQVNSGSYVCRNRALKDATGTLVTVHDSDDWSHPDKIRCQVENLKRNSWPYNLTAWVRTTDSLVFFGNPDVHHNLIVPDHSSGMFRREVLDEFNGWDAVRISGDTELFWRVERAMGNEKHMMHKRLAIRHCPLSFGRISASSLTQEGATSVLTINHGLRREYREAADHWHALIRNARGDTETHGVSKRDRPFPVPFLMRPDRSGRLALDVLFIADWNCADEETSGLLMRCLREVAAYGVESGLLHYPHYTSDVTAPLSSDVRQFAWENGITVLAPGESAEVSNVFVLTPGAFEHEMDRFPAFRVSESVVAVDVTETDGGVQSPEFERALVAQRLLELLGTGVEWCDGPKNLFSKLGAASVVSESGVIGT